jgi:hypothetical protein
MNGMLIWTDLVSFLAFLYNMQAFISATSCCLHWSLLKATILISLFNCTEIPQLAVRDSNFDLHERE